MRIDFKPGDAVTRTENLPWLYLGSVVINPHAPRFGEVYVIAEVAVGYPTSWVKFAGACDWCWAASRFRKVQRRDLSAWLATEATIEGPTRSNGALDFYVGLHQPGDGQHFVRACISIHRLLRRRKPVNCWVMIDSGAFTKLAKFGGYPEPVEVYAGQLFRLHTQGVVKIAVAAAQDYMCEPFMLEKTGLSVTEHQRLTIERYDALIAELWRLFKGPPPFPIMPVLQGFTEAEYLDHIAQYGERLTPGMWVGVGSVCKRQGSVSIIESLLIAIKGARPDLRLHGFRRETDRSAKPRCPNLACYRRQHGLVFFRSQTGSVSKRLARGQTV